MLGDDNAEIEDADAVRQLLNLDQATGPIRNAVEVAADGNEAVMADAPLEFEHGVQAMFGQALQLRLLGGEGFGDDALGGAVHADIGHAGEPVGELHIQIIEIAEAAAEEEVLADVAERPLDFPFVLAR